ncbi:uncharacterized protein [Nicotiana sylvestris]|uniref:uncharacterized protein n=1 Tax=Nicotiana sylvestris TaxID=4096 RepID=UPI00388C787D
MGGIVEEGLKSNKIMSYSAIKETTQVIQGSIGGIGKKKREEAAMVDSRTWSGSRGWKLFFDGAANMKGVGIGAVIIYETRHHYPVTAQLRFYCTNNMAECEAYILGLRLAADMDIQEILVLGDSDLLVHQIQGEWETQDLNLIPYRQCLHDLCQRF